MASGPGLSKEVVDRIYNESGWRYIGISDCYRVCPKVDFYYACDTRWWNVHYEKVKEWGGCENGYWCTEHSTKRKYTDLHCILGKGGNGWSQDPALIHYGSNSGFQILNIAYHLGIKHMVLVGFNMMVVDKKAHFFGDHPTGLSRNSSYHSFASQFVNIHPEKYGVTVINATQPTKLDAFPKMSLEDAIAAAPK